MLLVARCVWPMFHQRQRMARASHKCRQGLIKLHASIYSLGSPSSAHLQGLRTIFHNRRCKLIATPRAALPRQFFPGYTLWRCGIKAGSHTFVWDQRRSAPCHKTAQMHSSHVAIIILRYIVHVWCRCKWVWAGQASGGATSMSAARLWSLTS